MIMFTVICVHSIMFSAVSGICVIALTCVTRNKCRHDYANATKCSNSTCADIDIKTENSAECIGRCLFAA